MAHVLSQASALNPGHDLWIVPDASVSRWTMRLDWYLNFQITRSGRHVRPLLEKQLTGILDEIEWAPESPTTTDIAPLMVGCDARLPARWVAVLPGAADVPDWTSRLVTLWKGLSRPTLKVFLPTGLPPGVFSETWERLGEEDSFSMVLDQDPPSR